MGKFDNFNIPVFSLYKTFRNQLRTYNLLDSLNLIWGYSRNLIFNYAFPPDIELPMGFDPSSEILLRRINGLNEFELEFLLKEVIINSTENPIDGSLKQIKNLAILINYLRFSLRDEIDKNYITQTDVLVEHNRMMHNQFKWQKGVEKEDILRYYKIFSDNNVTQLVVNKFQLTTYELFITGFYLYVTTGVTFATRFPIKVHYDFITNEMLIKFFKHFSITIEQAKKELKEGQQMNEQLFYSYNPLAAKPILLYKDYFLCPIPLLLYWQITGGIYYSIIDEKGFANAFGESFQNYIGDIINNSGKKDNYRVLSEEKYKYGKEEKRSVDWIIEDDISVLFIECKAKRMTMNSKTQFSFTNGLETDLKKIAEFITQIYKTFIDYTEDKYPHIKYDSCRFFIPLLVTLEDWFITENFFLNPLIREYVIECFNKIHLDVSLIDKYPYYIRSSSQFERDIQIIYSLGIKEYYERLYRNELFEYNKSFNYINPFEGEFEKLFVEPLKKHNTPVP